MVSLALDVTMNIGQGCVCVCVCVCVCAVFFFLFSWEAPHLSVTLAVGKVFLDGGMESLLLKSWGLLGSGTLLHATINLGFFFQCQIGQDMNACLH